MKSGLFANVSTKEDTPKWKICVTREKQLYRKSDDIRNEFERDYTRILHSTAYRRLKHKTQVFSAPHNDHICTRIEHVCLGSGFALLYLRNNLTQPYYYQGNRRSRLEVQNG